MMARTRDTLDIFVRPSSDLSTNGVVCEVMIEHIIKIYAIIAATFMEPAQCEDALRLGPDVGRPRACLRCLKAHESKLREKRQ